jgi:hypothetical protein
MKKLYMADGHAVKEMLKITSLLLEALKIEQDPDDGFSSLANVDLSAKVGEDLANRITKSFYILLIKF